MRLNSLLLLVAAISLYARPLDERFALRNKTIISDGPFELHTAKATNDFLYLFASKNFTSTFLKIDFSSLKITNAFSISGFVVSYLPPMYDFSSSRVYLIYLPYQAANYRIAAFSLVDFSVKVNRTFSIPFTLGSGLVNSYMKSIYIPEEDAPLGNQLKQIALKTYNDTGNLVDLDRLGTVEAKHQNQNKPQLFVVQFQPGTEHAIQNNSITIYNLEKMEIERTWTNKDEKLFIYSSCLIPETRVLILGLGKQPDIQPGVALFDLDKMEVISVIYLDKSFQQKGYPTHITSNGRYVYFATNSQDIEHRNCYIWRIPVENFKETELEHIETTKETACNIVMLESNNNGAAFATDLGKQLFLTN